MKTFLSIIIFLELTWRTFKSPRFLWILIYKTPNIDATKNPIEANDNPKLPFPANNASGVFVKLISQLKALPGPCPNASGRISPQTYDIIFQ